MNETADAASNKLNGQNRIASILAIEVNAVSFRLVFKTLRRITFFPEESILF